MSRDVFSRLFVGTTIRELRHMRDVPRASMLLGQHPPVMHRRRSRWTGRLPMFELDDASPEWSRT